MPRHLVIASLWIEAETPGEATDIVAARLRGLKADGSRGAVVQIDDTSVETTDFRRTMQRLNLEEVVAV